MSKFDYYDTPCGKVSGSVSFLLNFFPSTESFALDNIQIKDKKYWVSP